MLKVMAYVFAGPAILRTNDTRLVVFVFYQLQFVKPVLYIMIDGDLRKGVTKSLSGCIFKVCPCAKPADQEDSSFITKSSSVTSKNTLGRVTKV